MTETSVATIERLAARVLAETLERNAAEWEKAKVRYGYDYDREDTTVVNVKPGKVYTKIDVGPAHNISGKYMVDNATGIIYGIKGYGKVHKGHVYGTLDTIDAWGWGEFTARRK